MKIRKARKEDLKDIQNVVWKTFKTCNFKEGSKEGIQSYLDWHNYKKNSKELKKVFERTKLIYVAVDKNKIIGIIRGNKNKIGNLFVYPKYHKKGIAKALMDKFENESKKLGSKEIKIKSSLYATPFYQKMGYKKITGIRNFIGIKIQPMRKKL